MARILIKREGHPDMARELVLGITRIGRAPDNHITIEHASVSSHHCEIEVDLEGMVIRDVGSTNGTFLDGQRIETALVRGRARLLLGDVETLVHYDDRAVSVPSMKGTKLPESAILDDGAVSCLNHTTVRGTRQCTDCGQVFCNGCVRHLHVKGGHHHYFCPVCHNETIPLVFEEAARKKTLWDHIKRVFGG